MKEHFFIQEGEGDIDELIYRRYLDDKMSASRVKVTEIKEYNRFRGIIKYYMNDDPIIVKAIDKSSYHKQDLQKVFKLYCKNKEVDYRLYFESSNKHIKFVPKLIGGIYHNSYKISGSGFNEGGEFNTTSNLNPSSY
ncbi:MAG: hypothetical protein C0597_08750 [Marinilabiliales bacterium]|nr:MAG: hypothetical protein C0597_08750 [Marinilabiliales bacterium]